MASSSGPSTAKVGLLVILFCILLYGGLHFLGTNFSADERPYKVLINDASGLTKGTPVTMSGVVIGQVASVALTKPNEATVMLAMNSGSTVPLGATAAIPSALIGLGTSELQIIPPAGSGPTKPLPYGSTILGTKTSPLDAVLPEAKETLHELTLTLKSTNALLQNQKLMANMNALLTNSNQAILRLSALEAQTQTLFANNSGFISKAMSSAADAMENIKKGTFYAQQLLADGQFKNQTLALLKSLTATSEKADNLVANLSKVAADPETQAAIKQSVLNAEQLTEQGKVIGKNVETLTANGATVSQEAIKLTQTATEVAASAKSLTDKLSGLVDKVSGKLGPMKSPLSVGKIQSEADIVRDAGRGRYRQDFNFTIPLGSQDVHLGVFDAFESNKLNLQLSRSLFRGADLRYGVYASKPGLGVDYSLAPRLDFSSDLFDLNQPSFDLRLKYGFSEGLFGWFGYDRIFNRSGLSFGIGIQK